MARTPQRKQCTKIKSSGKRCEAWAIHGSTVCVSHGGQLPTVKQGAQRRVALAKALAVLGSPREVDPHAALLEEVHRTAGHVAALALIVAELEKERVVGGISRTVQDPDGKRTVTVQAAYSIWLKLYQAERKHLLDACRTAIACGVERKRVELEERQGALIAQILRAVFDDPELGLRAPQRRVAMLGAARHLRLVASSEAG